MIKQNMGRQARDSTPYCFVFDRFTKIQKVADDVRIPGGNLGVNGSSLS